MGQIVRRVDQPPALADHDDPHSIHSHEGEGISVESELKLRAQPSLTLSWSIKPHYKDGSTLMVFHSTTGFCPENDPDDLTKHGRLIIETHQDDERILYLEEGQHFFTFLFRKKGFLGLFDRRSQPLRFSELVTSAKVGLSRIKDEHEFKKLNHESNLMPITHEAELNEAVARHLDSLRKLDAARNPAQPPKPLTPAQEVVAKEVAYIDAFIEALFAETTKLKSVQKDPRFKKLSKENQERVLRMIKERLAAAEVTSRSER